MNNTFDEIATAIRSAETVVIGCHVRPDGDAIGSLVALGHSLSLAGKKVRMFCEDPVPENLDFLPEISRVELSEGLPLGASVAIAVDTATKERLGARTVAAFADASVLVNIDHHGTNPRYGHLNHIDTGSPATGQIIYDLLSSQGFPIDKAVRDHLYTAISTDTGSFQFSSTTAHTHRIIAEMMDAGSKDFSELCQRIYHTQPKRRLMLQRALLNEIEFAADDRIAHWSLTRELQDAAEVRGGDTEGLIDLLRSIEGVVSAVFFEEMADGKIRVSVRSKDQRLDVSRVCAEFGGGGHRMASGARLAGPLGDAKSRFLEVLKNEIERIH